MMWKQFLIVIIALFLSISPSAAQDSNTFDPITIGNISDLQAVEILGRGEASSVAWKPDGEILAVASTTGIWFYDTDFNQVDHWPGDYTTIWQVEWTPDGEQLAIMENETLIVFRAGGAVAFEDEATIVSFSWHPFKDIIVTGSENRTVRFLNANTGELLQKISSTGKYVAWSPDGTKLAVGGDGIAILDADNLEPILNIQENQAGDVFQWSYDSSMLSGACYDEESFTDFGGTCIWDAETGDLIDSVELFNIVWVPEINYHVYYGSSPFAADAGTQIHIELGNVDTIQSGYWEQLRSVIWHPEYNRLTAMAFNGTIIEFSFPSGELKSEKVLHSTSVDAINISPDNSRILSTRESVVQVWDLSSMNDSFLSTPTVQVDTDLGTYTQAFVDVRWVNADEFITIEATYSDYDSSVYREISRRSAATGERIERLYRYLGPYDDSAAFNCGGSPSWDFTMFACVVQHELRVYTFDLETILLSVPIESTRSIYWSPDNTVLVLRRYVVDTESYTIEVRDLGNGELLYQVDTGRGYSEAVWNHDLTLLALPVWTAETAAIEIVDTQTYEVLATLPAENAIWHPSENVLALINDTTLMFWTPSQGILIPAIEVGRTTALDWSDDGQLIATANSNGTIRIWGVPADE